MTDDVTLPPDVIQAGADPHTLALEAALRRIEEGDEPRPLGKRWRADGQPSKLDECIHGRGMRDTCGNCISDFAASALTNPAPSADYDVSMQPPPADWVATPIEGIDPADMMAWSAPSAGVGEECSHEAWNENGRSRRCVDCGTLLPAARQFAPPLDEVERVADCHVVFLQALAAYHSAPRGHLGEGRDRAAKVIAQAIRAALSTPAHDQGDCTRQGA